MPELYEVSTSVKPEEPIMIPEQIVMPEVRFAAPSGTLEKDCSVEITVTVKKADGTVKELQFSGARITFPAWPAAGKEILGVLYMNFIEADIPVNPPVDVSDGAPQDNN